MVRQLVCQTIVALIFGAGSAEFNVEIIKVDGNTITYQKYKRAKKGTREKDGDPVKMIVAKDAAIVTPVIGPTEMFDPIEGGLRSDVFTNVSSEKSVPARVLVDDDTNKITKIIVVIRKKK